MEIKSITLEDAEYLGLLTPMGVKDHLAHAWVTLRELAMSDVYKDEAKCKRMSAYFKNRIACVKSMTDNKKILFDVAALEEEYTHI